MVTLKTLNSRIIFTVTAIVCLTIASSMLIVRWQTASTIQDIQKTNAKDLLKAITNTVENEYLSIEFHRQATLERRKEELKNLVDVAYTVLNDSYKNYQAGLRTETQAQQLSKQAIRDMRWAGDVGYFWINDTSAPFPKMIMHPTLPELDGKVLDDPAFDCALGRNENLFRTASVISQREGSGYVDYFWPKPTPDGSLTNKQPKLSFVRLFKPWNWVIGSGVYIDDIETETQLRLNAVIEELRQSFLKLHIGENSYIFLFTKDKQMLIHRELHGQNVSELLNPDTGGFLFDEIMLTEQSLDQTLYYRWKKPSEDAQKLFQKTLHVSYFEPLQWYICVSYYQDEINEPVKDLSLMILGLSILVLFVAVVLSFLLGKNLTGPLKKLSDAAETINNEGLGAAEIPISGSKETCDLGNILSKTLKTIGDNEQYLRASELKYRQLVENANDAIFIAQDEKITFANSKTLELTGYTFKELEEIPFVRLIHQDDQAMVVERYIQRLKGDTDIPATYSFRILDRNNMEYTVLLNSVLIEWRGQPAVLCFALDITEQKELEAAYLQAQKMEAIGTLASGIAHDFNNLLMAIWGRISLMSTDMENSHPHYRHFQVIEESIKSATNLTSQLLGIARGGKYEAQPIDINELVISSSSLFGRTNKAIKIKTVIHPSPIVVRAEKRQIEQVLLNLYVNAFHAMPDGGEILIKTTTAYLDEKVSESNQIAPGDYAHLSITDTGIGMDNETKIKIFDPFFTTKERGRGTGLGLSSAFGIIRNHNGMISVMSEINQGSTFSLYLPLSGEEAVPEEIIDEKLLTGIEMVLLVDDEEVVLEVGSEMLKSLGYRVKLATGGESALKTISEEGESIDLVIMDMIMPGMDGETLFFKIREKLPLIPILLSSGYSYNEQADAIMKGGCNGFIQKPFSLSDFSQKIRTVLDEIATIS
ncbi:cache domain-containing protein [Desulfopila sp. IMCC35008]|uniref:cache domain-containing protein n=1 Tax=Desulfopila sp. IMCC35008 TaxID=2653858 RepID=UPI0013D00A5F|nr:cache domain-containing protein [Desulfopila sp. IMCC35008]